MIYIALLRGINVGGNNIIKMEHLRQVFTNLGFSDVKTYIQSGNIIFQTTESDKLKLTQDIENKLQINFSTEIKTLILSSNQLAEIIAAAPENFGSQPEKFRYDVWFLLPETAIDNVVANVRLREGVDFLQAGKNAVYTSRLSEKMGKSYLSKIIQTSVYKKITIRNWNTTTKLLEMTKTKN